MATFKEQNAIRNAIAEIRRINNSYRGLADESNSLLTRLGSLSPTETATFEGVLSALGIDPVDFRSLVVAIKTINDDVRTNLTLITGTF